MCQGNPFLIQNKIWYIGRKVYALIFLDNQVIFISEEVDRRRKIIVSSSSIIHSNPIVFCIA